MSNRSWLNSILVKFRPSTRLSFRSLDNEVYSTFRKLLYIHPLPLLSQLLLSLFIFFFVFCSSSLSIFFILSLIFSSCSSSYSNISSLSLMSSVYPLLRLLPPHFHFLFFVFFFSEIFTYYNLCDNTIFVMK